MAYNIGDRWILFFTDGAETVSGCDLVTEFEPPMLAREFIKERRICQIGATPVFVGFKDLEGSLSYIGYSGSFQRFLLKHKWVTLNAKYVGEDYVGAVIKLRMVATIFFEESPIVGKTTADGLETNTVKFISRAIRLIDVDPVDSTETEFLKYESHTGVFEVDGVDQTAATRGFLTVP